MANPTVVANISAFLSSLVIHFPVRFATDAEQVEWLRSITAALGHYDADVLERAAQRIITTRRDRKFPLVSEIRAACAAVVEDDNRHKLPLEVTDRAAAYSSSRYRLADDLLRCEMGRRAAREGWVLELHNFAREHARLPDDRERKAWKTLVRDAEGRLTWTTVVCTEVEWCRRAVEGMRQAFAECVRGGFFLAEDLAKLGQSMLDKGEAMAERFGGQ